MPATEPSGIAFPGVDDSPYNYQAHMAALASSTQAALNDQANAYRGTGAQRNARLTGPNACPEGALWSDTDGSKILHQKRNGVWWPEIKSYNLHVISPEWNVNPNALTITNFGRVAHLQAHFFQVASYDWDQKQTIQLGTFDDKWAPPPGGITQQIAMDPGIDGDGTRPLPWVPITLLVALRTDALPIFNSRIMIFTPQPMDNTYTSPDKRAGISFSTSWSLPY